MPLYIDQSVDLFHTQIYVGNLPTNINAKQITELFEKFGIITRLSLKRRVTKQSTIRLPRPFVILIFERRESVDKMMVGRPFFLNDDQLFVHRCLPLSRRYPYEAYVTTSKMLVRVPQGNHDEILPNTKIIADYLKMIGGDIVRLERLDERTVLVEFADYDPVDVCCLSRPHFINQRMVDVEKCADEQQARRRAEFQHKSRSMSLKSSPASVVIDTDLRFHTTISPLPTLSIDEQSTRLQLEYHEMTHRFENEHEQVISLLKEEWEQVARERIRLQRLTLDYRQDQERLTKENRHWERLQKENLQEKARLQGEYSFKRYDDH